MQMRLNLFSHRFISKHQISTELLDKRLLFVPFYLNRAAMSGNRS